MNFIKTSLVLPFLVLMGCAHGVGIEYDPAFTTEELQAINDGISAWGPDWDAATAGKLIRYNKVDIIDNNSDIGGQTDFRTFDTKIEVYLVPMTAEKFAIAALHESGHVAGLEHVTDRPSVMQPLFKNMLSAPSQDDLGVLNVIALKTLH